MINLDVDSLKSLYRRLLRVPHRLAANACTLKEYTAVFAVADSKSVEDAIKEQKNARKQLYGDVIGLHNLRWYLVEMSDPAGPLGTPPRRKERVQPNLLVFTAVFDGDRDDFLDSLIHRAGIPVREVLRHCRGFAEAKDTRQFLASRRIHGGYFFRDLGKIGGLGTDPDYEGDASVEELSDALRVQAVFEAFYEANPPSTPAHELREAFKRSFDAHRTSLPLRRFERAVPGEARYVRKTMELNARLMERTRIKCDLEKPIRGAQAKAHGLVRATFAIDAKLDPKFRYGIFAAPGAVFDAWVRPANGYQEKRPDGKVDSRALTVSVDIKEPFAMKWAELVGERRPSPRSQDFLLFSHPTFFAPDVKTFVLLMGILTNGPELLRLPRLIPFIIGAGRTREVRVFLQMFLRRLIHPLAASFHSGTPYMLGPDTLVKYSVEPRDARGLEFFGKPGSGPDFLKDALEGSLRDEPIVLDFFIHVYPENQPSERVATALEDATVNWCKRNLSTRYGWRRFGRPLATKVRVATITLPPIARGPQSATESQPNPTGQSALEAAEARVCNPWNALEDHRPLGNLNRARYFVYRDGAERRVGAPRVPAAVAAHTEQVRPSMMPGPANEVVEPRKTNPAAAIRPDAAESELPEELTSA